jgi:hypothetical protein
MAMTVFCRSGGTGHLTRRIATRTRLAVVKEPWEVLGLGEPIK